MTITLEHKRGNVNLVPLPNGKHRVEAYLNGASSPTNRWETSYPRDLIEAILETKGPGFLCDEICRDEDPTYTAGLLEHTMRAYMERPSSQGMRVLDFGCGSGASAMILSRMYPGIQVTGVERSPGLIKIARLRAAHYGFENVQFHQSPSDDSLPSDLGQFDCVLLNAVFEHLLPNERLSLLPMLWDHVKPGGIMLVNETPYRWFPIETHTTGLPLINYLPNRAALPVARRFSSRVKPGESWKSLQRRGIRGGTAKEILSILKSHDSLAESVKPGRGIKTSHQIWLDAAASRNMGLYKGLAIKAVRLWTRYTGLGISPYLCIAFKKEH